MCRVIMVSRADFKAYDKQYGILKLMNHLEQECGGHGNGYALIKGGKIIETRKGQKLSNEEIYGRISGIKWDYLVYHTRINSMGGRGDANCHPFVNGNDCLAMNGTEHSLRTMADAFGRTDTECIFKNLVGLGLEQTTRALVEFSSVFVGCAGGKPFVVKAGGTLHKWGKTFHASTFPADVKSVKDLSAGYIWEDGKENLQFIKKSYDDFGGYGYSGYSYGGYGYGGYGYGGKKKSTAATVKTTDAAKKKADEKDSSWTKIYEMGEAAGYEDGYEDGYMEGYNDGREYERGSDECDGTFSEGYTMGYNDALAGVPMDIDIAEKTNPSSEYNIGFVEGRNAGYDEGYEVGYSEAEQMLGLKAQGQED